MKYLIYHVFPISHVFCMPFNNFLFCFFLFIEIFFLPRSFLYLLLKLSLAIATVNIVFNCIFQSFISNKDSQLHFYFCEIFRYILKLYLILMINQLLFFFWGRKNFLPANKDYAVHSFQVLISFFCNCLNGKNFRDKYLNNLL